MDFLDIGDRRIAYRYLPGTGPTVLFLPGYMSDMEGGKATALHAWAAETGRALLRFDYGGCGASTGRFEDETLETWLADVLALIDRVAQGPLLLVGSSMGGWLMLLAALARPGRVAALVGIAAAPDFTAWGFDEDQKRALREQGRIEEASPYGERATVTTRAFWESGEARRLLGAAIHLTCPVRLIHGLEDREVPWRISLEVVERLACTDACLSLVKGGDHRLSRPGDLRLLLDTVGALVDG